MEPKGSLPHSQKPATYPYSEPDRSSPCHYISLPDPVIYSWTFKSSLTVGFPHQTLYTPLPLPIRATCSAHLILLDWITRTTLGEEYISLGSSLCIFLHSPLTSPPLGTNILLSTLTFKSRNFTFKF